MEIAAVLRATKKHGTTLEANDTNLIVHKGGELPLAARRCIEEHEATFRTIASLQSWFRWLQGAHQEYLAGKRETYDEESNDDIEQFELYQRLLRTVQDYQECIWGYRCSTDGPLVCSACTLAPKPVRWQGL